MNEATPVGPWLGAHMSIAGSVERALDEAARIGAQAVQLFTQNSNRWVGKPIPPDQAEKFRARKETECRFSFSHDSYLINLASPQPDLWEKSFAAFLGEIDRAEMLGLDFIVFHPGAHMGEGVDKACGRVAESINRMRDQRPSAKVMVLIENAAGQGTAIGRAFEELALIRDKIEDKEWAGFCFDTCHAFAAGYDLRTKEGYEQTMMSFDRSAGLSNLRAFHLNDSKKGLNCRVDRHQHIGKGEIGLDTFRCLLTDTRFQNRPMVIETPKSPDLHEDIENLSLLRSLRTAS